MRPGWCPSSGRRERKCTWLAWHRNRAIVHKRCFLWSRWRWCWIVPGTRSLVNVGGRFATWFESYLTRRCRIFVHEFGTFPSCFGNPARLLSSFPVACRRWGTSAWLPRWRQGCCIFVFHLLLLSVIEWWMSVMAKLGGVEHKTKYFSLHLVWLLDFYIIDNQGTIFFESMVLFDWYSLILQFLPFSGLFRPFACS